MYSSPSPMTKSAKEQVIAWVRSKNPQTIKLKYGVWWLSQQDYDRIYSSMKKKLDNLPEYIQNEFRSREGRAGRGRLWVPDFIELEMVDWNDDLPICKVISKQSSGGIVILYEDVKRVLEVGGICTDIKMNRILGSDMGLQEFCKALTYSGFYYTMNHNFKFAIRKNLRVGTIEHVEWDDEQNLHEQSEEFYESLLPLLPTP